MKFRLTLITLLLTGFLLQVFGQERVNKEKLSFDSASGILTKATGWANNTVYGEWVDYENVISEDKDFKDKLILLQGSWMMSQTGQSFLNVQTKTVTHDGTTFYVLVIEKWDGRYEYPSIYEDWYTFKQTIGYIFTEEEYKKLLNIESLVELKTPYMVSTGSKYEEYDEQKFLYLVHSQLSKEISKYTRIYTFPVMKSIEGDIRFYLPVLESRHFSTYDFEKRYFETDIENFSKIILK